MNVKLMGFIFGVLGSIGVMVALILDPTRFFANTLVWFILALSIGLGCLFLVGLEHVVSSRWSVPIRRVPERLSGFLLPALFLAIITLLGGKTVFTWAIHSASLGPAKALWFQPLFFVGRIALCFFLWWIAYRFFVKGSFAQDETGDANFTIQARRRAAPFLWLFASTLFLVSVDWLLGMEPHWLSSVWGVYLFGSVVASGLSATAVGVAWLMGRGRLPGVNEHHLFNIGGLLFAFILFWSYIAFSQFMLIWYANIPEEASFFVSRTHGYWGKVVLGLAVLHFAVPFFGLLSRDAKAKINRLRWVAYCALAAHLLDLYWIVFPALHRPTLKFGWVEVSFGLLLVPSSLWWASRLMRNGKDMPVGDPNLKAGLAFHL